MQWKAKDKGWNVPVYNWATNLEPGAYDQAQNLAKMPCVFHHVAIMPDGHQGYAIPIGGVVALKNAVSPYGVGNDCSCGMHAVETSLDAGLLTDMRVRRELFDRIKQRIPVGESVHAAPQEWSGFEEYLDNGGLEEFCSDRIRRSLGTEGAGNHFVEIQSPRAIFEPHLAKTAVAIAGKTWFMIHSGSRNLGAQLAKRYHDIAVTLCKRWHTALPSEEYAFLPIDDQNAQDYLSDMRFAMKYASESRNRMATAVLDAIREMFPNESVEILFEHDINHNYAALENHFNENVWVHRKGATSAREGEIGIIPGSMGTSSYIVEGLGNPDSFMSCSHGAGRRMSRSSASQSLSLAECDAAMDGIVCDRWNKVRHGKCKGEYDLSEAPGAYKDIEEVIANEADLVKPLVALKPLVSIKG